MQNIDYWCWWTNFLGAHNEVSLFPSHTEIDIIDNDKSF